MTFLIFLFLVYCGGIQALSKKFDPEVSSYWGPENAKRFDPYAKRFDPYTKKFDPLSKKFDPMFNKRFDPYTKKFDPTFDKKFDPMFDKRFDPLSKRFDPFSKRFDPFSSLNPFTKRFEMLEKRQDSGAPYVRKFWIHHLDQSKRNIIDPQAFQIGFGRK
ncbi:unnamed protein product [Caenorhabditis angaria]|uniref:Uncharacterized protein n=1 Tax=Caenorhabditis angaria TaxID=860376 RepID=A0A9P1J1V4_9PELO|nr:unnamed protein product [Caenorhabditis angaria]